jgi:hypothetical protein
MYEYVSGHSKLKIIIEKLSHCLGTNEHAEMEPIHIMYLSKQRKTEHKVNHSTKITA